MRCSWVKFTYKINIIIRVPNIPNTNTFYYTKTINLLSEIVVSEDLCSCQHLLFNWIHVTDIQTDTQSTKPICRILIGGYISSGNMPKRSALLSSMKNLLSNHFIRCAFTVFLKLKSSMKKLSDQVQNV